MFTNSPVDTTVCMGSNANMPCGFSNVSDLLIPIWNITMRSNDGSIISNEFSVNAINTDDDDGLEYFADTVLGDNMSPDSRLVVGPVDEADNQSSYQCIFVVAGYGTFKSSTGTLIAIGECMYIENVHKCLICKYHIQYVHPCDCTYFEKPTTAHQNKISLHCTYVYSSTIHAQCLYTGHY